MGPSLRKSNFVIDLFDQIKANFVIGMTVQGKGTIYQLPPSEN
jgi:hypothetical protein